MSSPPPGALNIANALTVLRVLLVPLVAWALLRDGGDDPVWRFVAAGAFVVASLTDVLDGDLARRRGIITDFGKLADPIADKALTGTALVSLSVLGELPWLVTAVIVVRELGVTLLRFWVIRHGVMPASRGGKLKTMLLGAALTLYLAPHPGLVGVLAAVLMGAAVLVAVATGVDYVVKALRLRAAAAR